MSDWAAAVGLLTAAWAAAATAAVGAWIAAARWHEHRNHRKDHRP